MKDVPDRIWLLGLKHHQHQGDCVDLWTVAPGWSSEEPNLHEYLRADLARLPDGLVERLKDAQNRWYGLTPIERDILAWHEKGGEK